VKGIFSKGVDAKRKWLFYRLFDGLAITKDLLEADCEYLGRVA
jgi:hypothetical protein